MSAWNHSVCAACWNERNPDKPDTRAALERTALVEKCCFCEMIHVSGIYIRQDPDSMPCKGEHPFEAVSA